MGISRIGFGFTMICFVGSAIAEAPPPIEAFAALPQMRGPSLSPDGTRIAFITSIEDRSVAAVGHVGDENSLVPLLRSEPGKYDIEWCRWANDRRILCGTSMVFTERGKLIPFSRLIGVDSDGSNLKVLLQNTSYRNAQYQDQILDWTPNDPQTVLMQLDEDLDGVSTVHELDVHTGKSTRVVAEHQRFPLYSFATDGQGDVRLAWGYYDDATNVQYFGRLVDDKAWRRLAKIEAFQANDALAPIAVVAGTNRAYAIGTQNGLSSLWEMDLLDEQPPRVVFSHPKVDVDEPLFARDGRLTGVWYEDQRPAVHYVDEKTRVRMEAIDKALPGRFNYIVDTSADESRLLIRSSSDVDAGTYLLYDEKLKHMAAVGESYPQLDPSRIAPMQAISYPARDGASIPGYLTIPSGAKAQKLPLIVMPHGGPISRDGWRFSFLRAFLVSRGYAVLQMNFRGSSGYGWDWYSAAHQDWGGLTYSDIHDGTRWAIEQGIADPNRVAIVGWSFGGYAALLGAVRNSDVYRCAVSIAGVSDLPMLLNDERHSSSILFQKKQIGTDWSKLREDSPLRHIEKIKSPILLVHGTQDYVVEVGHSEKMSQLLSRKGKAHKSVILEGATHQLDRQSDRLVLLTELEAFLRQNMQAD